MTYVKLVSMMLLWAWGFIVVFVVYLFLRYQWREYWRVELENWRLDKKIKWLFFLRRMRNKWNKVAHRR